jgi:hypothetical protein
MFYLTKFFNHKIKLKWRLFFIRLRYIYNHSQGNFLKIILIINESI